MKLLINLLINYCNYQILHNSLAMRDEIDDTIDDESKTESRGMKKDIHLRLAVSVLFRA